MSIKHNNASTPVNPRRGTPLAALALAFGLATLAGCGGGNDEGDTQNAGAATPVAPTTNGAAAPTPGSSGANTVDAPADENPRGTVDGTLALFISAMEEGEFEQAVELVDPTTDLHAELLGLIENVETASAIDDPNAGNIGNMIRMTFALTYAGADYEIVSEDESRARAVITRPGANNDQHTVELNKVDGEWSILAGRGLIRSAGSPPPVPPRPSR